jgi:hypothetical protein
MEYNRIIAVTGLPGLFELVSSKNDGAIVRSLDDRSTKFVSSRIHNFSHLESIEIYTVRDNVNLVEVFNAMEKSADKLPDGKDAAALKAFFKKIYPDMDFERVYASDMKKMIKWFEVLKKNEIEIKLTEPAEEVEEPAEVTEPVEEAAAPAKTKSAKASAPKAEAAAAETEEAKPAKAAKKKAAPKKEAATEEATEEKPKKTARKKKEE